MESQFTWDIYSQSEATKALTSMLFDSSTNDDGYFNVNQLQKLFERLRDCRLSIPQIEASMKYVCSTFPDIMECDEEELIDVLKEMDRRYFLAKDLVWDFAMLDREGKGSIPIDDAKMLFRLVHGEYFSPQRFDALIEKRIVKDSDIAFEEIEVELCNIPTYQWIEEKINLQRKKEKEEKEAARIAADIKRKEEERIKIEKEEILRKEEQERLRKEKEEKERKEKEEKRKKEEEERLRKKEERIRREKERLNREEDERRQKEEAERARKEEERLKQEQEERLKKEEEERRKEEQETLKREEEERHKKEEEENRKKEEEERLKQEEERRRTEEEERRMEEERLKQEEEERVKKEEERRRKEEVEKLKQEEEERLKKEEERRRQTEKEEKLKEEEEKLKKEEERRRKEEEEERLKQEEERLKQEEIQRKIQEEKMLQEEKEAREASEAENSADAISKAEDNAELQLRQAEDRVKTARSKEERREAEEEKARAAMEALKNREKRLRLQLSAAVKLRHLPKLTVTIDEAKESKIDGLKPDIKKAELVSESLKCGENLEDAMVKRDINQIEDAIQTIKNNSAEKEHMVQIIEAEKLVEQLKRLQRSKQDILELNQRTIAIVRSYSNPLPAIHDVMVGTYMVLGYKEKELKQWKFIQALLGRTGKESLKRMCTTLEASKVDLNVCKVAEKKYFGKHTLESITDISAGIGTFYNWSSTMIEEARNWVEDSEFRKAIEEKRKKEEEEINALKKKRKK